MHSSHIRVHPILSVNIFYVSGAVSVLPDGLLSMFMPHTFKCPCQVLAIQH